MKSDAQLFEQARESNPVSSTAFQNLASTPEGMATLESILVAADPLHPPRARFGWRPRFGLVAGLAAVAALAVIRWPTVVENGTDLPPAELPPAYTVSADGDTVTVEVNDLRDAKGLERKLREAGVPAVVQYLPPDPPCTQEAFTVIGHSAIRMTEDGSMGFEIDKSVLEPDQRLFIYTSQELVYTEGESSEPVLVFSVVDGKVAGC